MKFTLALAANLLAGAAVASPRPTRLQESSFALEGYAKENPLGETTGGKGGPTTTVTAAAALATAVKVRKTNHQAILLAVISDSVGH
jgi:pectate lyase